MFSPFSVVCMIIILSMVPSYVAVLRNVLQFIYLLLSFGFGNVSDRAVEYFPAELLVLPIKPTMLGKTVVLSNSAYGLV